MNSLNDYSFIPYVENGRDEKGLDCWGLVRCVWRDVFSNGELPLLSGVAESTAANMTRQFKSIEPSFVESEFDEEMIACAFVGGVFVHVGIVVYADYRLWIMETDKNTGVTLTQRRDFEKRYSSVRYYEAKK